MPARPSSVDIVVRLRRPLDAAAALPWPSPCLHIPAHGLPASSLGRLGPAALHSSLPLLPSWMACPARSCLHPKKLGLAQPGSIYSSPTQPAPASTRAQHLACTSIVRIRFGTAVVPLLDEPPSPPLSRPLSTVSLIFRFVLRVRLSSMSDPPRACNTSPFVHSRPLCYRIWTHRRCHPSCLTVPSPHLRL